MLIAILSEGMAKTVIDKVFFHHKIFLGEFDFMTT